MIAILPDLLRAVVSDIFNVLNVSTMIEPKKRKSGILVLLSVMIINLTLDIYCYMNGSLTQLVWLDFVLFTILCFAIRPFFEDNLVQWLFSYVTAQNIELAVVIVSFVVSRYLPYPVYANTVVRLLLFIIIYMVFRFLVRPIYRQSLEHWDIYFYVSMIICFSFLVVFLSGDNIVTTLTMYKMPLMLVVLLAASAYYAVFYTLKILSKEYKLQEENLTYQSRQELMRLSIVNLEQQLSMMDEKEELRRREAHDSRHYKNTILELIKRGEIEEVKKLLSPKNTPIEPIKQYCENRTVNAVITNMENRAKDEGITLQMRLDIPKRLSMDDIEFAMVIANLLENALQAVEKMNYAANQKIRFTCLFTGAQLLLEIVNPYEGDVLLNEEGYPVASREMHGIGTINVIAFAQKHNAQLIYEAENGVFRVRMMI